MKSRNWLSLDLATLLGFPLILGAITVLMGALFPVFSWFHHPTAPAWLWTLFIASSTAVVGCVLLFIAKLPQYREGVFLRLGSQQLPAREQRLYRVAFWLIVPSILTLLALLSTVHRFN